MEIHKPKGAIHGWRELAKEIGTIVIGVLIALGAEQAVEALHWQHRVHGAETAMRAELQQSNRDAYYRLALNPCATAWLAKTETALVAARDRDAPVSGIERYRRPLRPWQTDEWDNARALQITDHLPTARLTAYSQAYFFARVLGSMQPLERDAMDAVNTLPLNAGRLQPTERDRLFLAVVGARDTLHRTDLAAWLLLQRTAVLGLKMTPADKAAGLAAARADFGACAAAPDLANWPS